MEIKLTKATQITEKMKIEDLKINITGRIDDSMSIKEHRDFFEKEAETLANALEKTLPGGTLDRLIGILLTHKATCFRVPLYEE